MNILTKVESKCAATCVAIPNWIWMEKHAPGAAEAARMTLLHEKPSKSQQRRLARLMGEDRLMGEKIRSAWQMITSRANEKKLSEAQLYAAQHELMREAYSAADFTPIGKSEIEDEKARLEQIGKSVQRLAREIREVGTVGTVAPQLYGAWNTYRANRPDNEILAALPDSLPSIATSLDGIADFFRLAAPLVKPGGPVQPVERPNCRAARRTTVIHKIALVCQQRLGAAPEELHSVIAALANAALNLTDIDSQTVRGSLKPKKKVLKSKQGNRRLGFKPDAAAGLNQKQSDPEGCT